MVKKSMIKITKTPIEDLLIVEPQVYGDERGYFFEVYKKSDFTKEGLNYNFVQENQSKSKKGVLRGLHFQKTYPQAKLVRVLDGEVFDVAVDLRNNSKTYGKWFGLILSGENKKMFIIPKGFAHGFLVVSDMATFEYKCDEFYHPEDEGGIIWNDPDINVEWPEIPNIILSEKDKNNPKFRDIKMVFNI